MDLKALHSMMSRKKIHYFDGDTNSKDDCLYINFSTGHNGRGSSVDLRLSNDNDITIHIQNNAPEPPTIYELKNVSDNEIFSLIEEQC